MRRELPSGMDPLNPIPSRAFWSNGASTKTGSSRADGKASIQTARSRGAENDSTAKMSVSGNSFIPTGDCDPKVKCWRGGAKGCGSNPMRAEPSFESSPTFVVNLRAQAPISIPGAACNAKAPIATGNPQGFWKSFHFDGSLRTEGGYKRGRRHGIWSLYAE